MGKIIAVHSFLRGVGKSNMVANLGFLLAEAGRRVGMVDTDVAAPALHYPFHLDEGLVPHTFNDYVLGKCPIHEAVVDLSDRLGPDAAGHLYLVPASDKPLDIVEVMRKGYDVTLLGSGLIDMEKDFNLDFLLVDSQAGFNETSLSSIAVADILVMVLCLDCQHYQGTSVVIDMARRLDVPDIGLIINQVSGVYQIEEVRARIEETFECPVVAVLPFSKNVDSQASTGLAVTDFPDDSYTVLLKQVAESWLN
jgi:MinD-like ATPase involved in chromosome partitioning or flagellar assembly